MPEARKITLLALLLLGISTLVQAVVQAPVKLSPIQQIRKGVDEWPLILNPKSDVERRINVQLTDLNARLAKSLKDCDAAYSASPMATEHLSPDEEGAKSWTQDVKVTMLGPALLSFVATTSFYCGGAHPYGFTDAAVFDLKTGNPADPISCFQPSRKVSPVEDDDANSALEKSVSVEGLLQAYREATHHECDQTYSDDQSFLIWPDANLGKVMIQADRLPGCCEACGIETGITLEQARKLGFSETFLQTISDAHKRLAQPR